MSPVASQAAIILSSKFQALVPSIIFETPRSDILQRSKAQTTGDVSAHEMLTEISITSNADFFLPLVGRSAEPSFPFECRAAPLAHLADCCATRASRPPQRLPRLGTICHRRPATLEVDVDLSSQCGSDTQAAPSGQEGGAGGVKSKQLGSEAEELIKSSSPREAYRPTRSR